MHESIHGLNGLAALDSPPVILCASHRLTRELRLAHGRAQAAAGRLRWAALQTATLSQWCGAVLREALLSGALPPGILPRRVLSAMQERVLWEQVIADDAAADDVADFYDRAGLAAAAAEANALAEAWRLPLNADMAASTEAARFLAWREVFRQRCKEHGWLEAVRALEGQVDALARGAGRMPAAVVFAGFSRMSPQEARLARVLSERGVRIFEFHAGRDAPAEAQAVALPDRAAECRAAAAWAAQRLNDAPGSRIAIVVPELAALRDTLDDSLAAALPGRVRRHAFAVGAPLARQPLVQVALELLVLAASVATSAGRVEQARLGELLRGTYWTSEIETDARHRLEARMREKLPPEISIERLARLLRRAELDGLAAPQLLAHLEALQAFRQPGRHLPSHWRERFAELLAAVGWPGERPLLEPEAQAQAAFDEMLVGLSDLDGVLGKVGAGDTANRLRKLCAERMFLAESGNAGVAVQVMGPLEPLASPYDALWVMGMNDHLWPPPPRANPLLPAELQRRATTPEASAEVQVALARAAHERLLRSAPTVVFSCAQADGGRALRPSPLLAGVPMAPEWPAVPGQVESLAGGAMEQLYDAKAPAVAAGEKVKGGTGLLRAQAICPAWAFYRYRLGAKALEEPVEGLDARGRGTLLHAVLEAFWRDRGSHDLRAMDAAARSAAIAVAVAAGLAAFNALREDPLPPRFLALEGERLVRLVGQWLDLELTREVPFQVLACEREITLDIEDIAVRLVLDRVDRLEDGSLLIIDYKTSATVSAQSWGEQRITEPQLPVYAAHAANAADGEVAGVALAKVRLDECGFAGIAVVNGLLPKVAGIGDDAARRIFPAVSGWPELLAVWRDSIGTIAREVGDGVAAVVFADEKDLAWCEVLPLLRLAERESQLEAGDD